jgi:hypothetical protein
MFVSTFAVLLLFLTHSVTSQEWKYTCFKMKGTEKEPIHPIYSQTKCIEPILNTNDLCQVMLTKATSQGKPLLIMEIQNSLYKWPKMNSPPGKSAVFRELDQYIGFKEFKNFIGIRIEYHFNAHQSDPSGDLKIERIDMRFDHEKTGPHLQPLKWAARRQDISTDKGSVLIELRLDHILKYEEVTFNVWSEPQIFEISFEGIKDDPSNDPEFKKSIKVETESMYMFHQGEDAPTPSEPIPRPALPAPNASKPADDPKLPETGQKPPDSAPNPNEEVAPATTTSPGSKAPIIVGVVLFIVMVILFLIAAYLLFRHMKSKKHSHSDKASGKNVHAPAPKPAPITAAPAKAAKADPVPAEAPHPRSKSKAKSV